MKYLLFISFLIISLFSYSQENKITDLVIRGNFEITLFQSDSEEIYIHAPLSITKSVKTDYKNGIYTLTNLKNSNKLVKVFMIIKDLNSIKATGNVNIITPTNIYLNNMTIELDKQSNAKLYINSDRLNLDIKGDGNLFISGEIDTLNIKAEDNVDIIAKINSYNVYSTIKDDVQIVYFGNIHSIISNNYDFTTFDNTLSNTGISTINSYDSSLNLIRSQELILFQNDKSLIVYDGILKTFKTEEPTNLKIKY